MAASTRYSVRVAPRLVIRVSVRIECLRVSTNAFPIPLSVVFVSHRQQFIKVVLRGLPVTADAELEGVLNVQSRYHSAPPSTTIAAPSMNTIATITRIGGRSARA